MIWVFYWDIIYENRYEFIDNIIFNEKWKIMRNMIISIMMLDELSHEIDVMIFYARMFMLVYDMMIDKLNCGIDAMTFNMKIYIFIYELIVFVNVRLIWWFARDWCLKSLFVWVWIVVVYRMIISIISRIDVFTMIDCSNAIFLFDVSIIANDFDEWISWYDYYIFVFEWRYRDFYYRIDFYMNCMKLNVDIISYSWIIEDLIFLKMNDKICMNEFSLKIVIIISFHENFYMNEND